MTEESSTSEPREEPKQNRRKRRNPSYSRIEPWDEEEYRRHLASLPPNEIPPIERQESDGEDD